MVEITLLKVYKNLGTVEIQDQISVTRKLVESYDYMDPTRVAIWGNLKYLIFPSRHFLPLQDGPTEGLPQP